MRIRSHTVEDAEALSLSYDLLMGHTIQTHTYTQKNLNPHQELSCELLDTNKKKGKLRWLIYDLLCLLDVEFNVHSVYRQMLQYVCQIPAVKCTWEKKRCLKTNTVAVTRIYIYEATRVLFFIQMDSPS